MSIWLIVLALLTAAGGITSYIIDYRRIIKEEESYQNSLFRQLKRLYLTKSDITDPVLEAYNTIRYKILNLETRNKFRMENMKLIDSLTFHELNALKEVANQVERGIPLSDTNIKNALIQITDGLNKQFNEFCKLQTIGVQQETLILETLKQREEERQELMFKFDDNQEKERNNGVL
ncbi:hypothetical protein D7X33_17720 [Butyricicoccus sp. 1XD8-22]|nr:hypothetical protein D7X33_17720 [Butyricicoccus sp. 1XD8-22]